MSLSLFAVSYLLVTFVSLVDALDVHNEETRLRTIGLLSSLVSVLTAWSSSSACAPQLPLPSLAPFYFYTWRGSGLHCNHCGQDGHVESFCYRKKNQGLLIVLQRLVILLLEVQLPWRCSCSFIALLPLHRRESLVQ